MNEFAKNGLERIGKRTEALGILQDAITPNDVLDFLGRLQDPAPSGTVIETRGPILAELIASTGVPVRKFELEYLNTANPAVALSKHPNVIFSAHSDQPSYFVPASNDTSFNLSPNCAHRVNADLKFSGAIVRRTKQGVYEIVSEGFIGSDNKGKPYYEATNKPQDGFNPGLDRAVFLQKMSFDATTGLITGNIDNAAGNAVALASLKGLKAVKDKFRLKWRDFGIAWVFPDEEEGLPIDNTTFSKGARKLARKLETRVATHAILVNLDGHDMDNPGPDALYAAYSSAGKGATTFPHVYAQIDAFAQTLEPHGISFKRSESVGASVSRSDDPAWMEAFPRIVIAGYGVRDPHHNANVPTANLEGLVNSARAMAAIAVGNVF